MSKKINIKPITILIVVVGFLILLKFQFPHYRVASNNMLPTLLKGDIVLVNKLITSTSIKNNDICVFQIDKKVQLNRMVGLPGDKIEIVNGVLFINDVKELEVETSFTYKIFLGNHPPLADYNFALLLKPTNQYGEYTAEFTEKQVKEIAKVDFVKSITKVIHPKGYHYSFIKNPIFPNQNSFNWSRDNFGPIIIPKKGDKLLSNNITIKSNYYFAIGDSRHQSLDSRYFGFISEENIIGRMIGTLYSVNE